MPKQFTKQPCARRCVSCRSNRSNNRTCSRFIVLASVSFVLETALINHMRGLLAEYGVILPQGAWRFTTQVTTAIEEAELSDLTREIFMDMLDQFSDLNRQLDKLDAQLVTICRTNETCRRLSKVPGVGPVIATALVAAVDDGRHFHSGRELAAWIGLVPRQYTTGGKPRLGGIGRRANHYLRRQMIHGARSVVMRLVKHDDRRFELLKGLAARRGINRTIVALAQRLTRRPHAVLGRRIGHRNRRLRSLTELMLMM